MSTPSRASEPYAPAFAAALLAPRYWPAWFGLGLLRLGAMLPRRLWSALGGLGGELYYRLSRKRRRIALINLALCFPGLSARERRALARAHFRVLMQSVLDFGWVWWSSPRGLDARVHVVNREHYERARAGGRNVILLTGHIAALEVGAMVVARWQRYVGLVKPVRNKLVDWVMTRARTRFGGDLFLRSQGIRPIVRAIKNGSGFYYLPDEDLGPKDSVFVPFFGVQAATLSTLGRLAAMTDAVVVPCFTRLLPHGRGYEMVFYPPLLDLPTGDPVADAVQMNAALERAIRDMPEQYMWSYKRFKTRPDGAPSPYEPPSRGR